MAKGKNENKSQNTKSGKSGSGGSSRAAGSKPTGPRNLPMTLIADNKKARFDYEISETWEAGLMLTGSEIKSVREGQVNLKDAYIAFVGDQAYLQNAHISPYKASSYNNHVPERLRKLLMHRHELDDIAESIQVRGLTCVPLKLYLKGGIAKLEIGLAKGRKHGDKREHIKDRDVKREIAQTMRSKNRS